MVFPKALSTTSKRFALVFNARLASSSSPLFRSFRNAKGDQAAVTPQGYFSTNSIIKEKARSMCTNASSSFSLNTEASNINIENNNSGASVSAGNEDKDQLETKNEAEEAINKDNDNLSPKHEETKGEVHEFKAETRKLLHIVTHSLYTDKEVFIRELISNASDALEKLRFLKATGQAKNLMNDNAQLKIVISVDPAAKTITFEDNGVGMSRQELVDNLGTIAKSGSLNFIKQNNAPLEDKANAIIGQFGVGFYSSFVVSRLVEVFSCSYLDAENENKGKGTHWISDGLGSYTVKECEGLSRGTKVVCHFKDECVEFSNIHNVKSCAQKFSSFVSFPLHINEGDKITELNKQEAVWLKDKPTDEEHLSFFRFLNNSSWGEPMYTLMYKTDAPLSIKSVFYIPDEAPSRLFQSKTEIGISLHSKRILVKKSANEIIPKWLFWLKGVVDCEDLPLNVSRENMQDSLLIEKLSFTLIKRILRFLEDQYNVDPVKFQKFYDNYSYYLKEGLLEDAQKSGKYKDNLLKLLRYECSGTASKSYISLDEYINRMKPNQKNIYYICATDRNTAMVSPYMEDFLRRKRDVLLMFDDIDEFVAMNIQNYKDKKFVSVDSPDGDFEPLLEESLKAEDEQKVDIAKLVGDQQTELEQYIKSVLGSKVTAVKFSDRLVNSPGIVSGFLSATLRKMMKATLKGASDAQMSLASLPATLELNPSHPIVTSLYHLKSKSPDVAKLITEQLYDNACVAAGILDDPKSMLSRLNNILEITSQYAYHHHSSGSDNNSNDIKDSVDCGIQKDIYESHNDDVTEGRNLEDLKSADFLAETKSDLTDEISNDNVLVNDGAYDNSKNLKSVDGDIHHEKNSSSSTAMNQQSSSISDKSNVH